MIPLRSTVCFRSTRHPGLKICVPLFLLWLLLVAFGLLLLPVLLIACLIARVNPLRAFVVFWQVITALKGTNIEVNQAGRSIAVRLP